MPRFFIHVRQGDTLSEDPEGNEFPNPEAAWEEAWAAACELIAAQLRENKFSNGQIEVWDEAGRRLATVPFYDVIKTFAQSPYVDDQGGATLFPALFALTTPAR